MLGGVSRVASAEFSFFMAIPAMVGASGIKLLGFVDYLSEAEVAVPFETWAAVIFGMAVSFVVSLAAIKFLMDFVKKHGFSAFGVYRIVLGVLVLSYFLIR
jgi:undecaprenyl-diphosphatase